MPLQRITHSGAAPPTNLLSSITATALSFGLTSSTGYPTGSGGPFVIDIDAGLPTEEKILCSSLSGGTITVAPGGRGWDGTIAVAHTPGTALAPNVTHIFSSSEADDANAHIYTVSRDDHTQYANVVGNKAGVTRVYASAAQTLSTTLSIIQFNAVAFDTMGGWNANTYTYTCNSPVTAFYRVHAVVAIASAACGLLIQHNGSFTYALGPGSAVNYVNGVPIASVEAIVQAATGDTLTICAAASASVLTIASAGTCFADFQVIH